MPKPLRTQGEGKAMAVLDDQPALMPGNLKEIQIIHDVKNNAGESVNYFKFPGVIQCS